MKLSREQRATIHGMFGGRCAYCGSELTDKWHVDHVEAVWRASKYVTDKKTGYGKVVSAGYCHRPDNQREDNLFPACVPCNIDKGVESIEDWRSWLQDRMIESMRKHIPNFRHAERFGRITVNAEPIVFWFETFRHTHSEGEE